MNWHTPLYWFFCKINDPITSPSAWGACMWCRVVHGECECDITVPTRRTDVLNRDIRTTYSCCVRCGKERKPRDMQTCQHEWEQLDATYHKWGGEPIHYKVPHCKKCGMMYV